MQQHFVTFYSPGTFVAECTELPIASWDIELALTMSTTIHERYDATPYGFRFSTRARTAEDLDSTVTSRSPFYYIVGTVETVEQIEARNDPTEAILRSNMRNNGFKRVIVT